MSLSACENEGLETSNVLSTCYVSDSAVILTGGAPLPGKTDEVGIDQVCQGPW